MLKEKARIDHSHENTDLMTVRKLTKRFDDLTAVDSMSFGVHYQECFGLLGVNGAGKSTTFRMLCGDLLPSSGNAYLHQGRFSLLDNLRSYEQNIGYCSQESALLGKMTGEEMLYLFARLRGIPDAVMKRDIDNLIRMTGMEDQADKLIESLSGGNRRKLHLALSMVGSPSICFLDEPTSGVDPVARRKIWQALGYMKRLNSSIVLTSHVSFLLMFRTFSPIPNFYFAVNGGVRSPLLSHRHHGQRPLLLHGLAAAPSLQVRPGLHGDHQSAKDPGNR